LSGSKAGNGPLEAPARRGRDVFISYSRHDKETADAVCAALESAGISCWIGPRDTQAGAYGRSIMEAIRSARMLVLILSPHADNTMNVLTEVAEAFDRKLPLLPFRLSNFAPSDQMRFYIRTQHWIDAFPGVHAQYFASLIEQVRESLGTPTPAPREGPVAATMAGAAATPSPPRRRRWALGLTAVLGALSVGLTISFTSTRTTLKREMERFDPAKSQASLVRVVVALAAAPGQATAKSLGTGFVIDRGYVATAGHVVDAPKSVGERDGGTVRYFVRPAGSNATLPAEIAWKSDRLDLAILRVPELDTAALTLWSAPTTEDPAPGSRVFALGYAAPTGGAPSLGLDQPPSLTEGTVERTVSKSVDGGAPVRTIQHSARLSGGSSGSPLFDACGRVVGINAYAFPDRVSGASVPHALHIGLLTEALRREGALKIVRPAVSEGKDCGR
jgi:S1-C subfamily serine protease